MFQFYFPVSKDIDAEDDSVLTRMLQAIAAPVLGNVCHVFMHGLNCIQVIPIASVFQLFNFPLCVYFGKTAQLFLLSRYLEQKNCNMYCCIDQRTSL